jgi:sugar/nucleoside kinase (ribokinase family)
VNDFSENHLDSNIIHFSPLTPDEIDINCIQEAKRRHALTSLDVQGFVRSIDDRGFVMRKEWNNPEPTLRLLDVVKSHEDELRLVQTGESELAKVSEILNMGPRIVLVTRDRRGSTIYTRNSQVEIPLVLSRANVDSTGCGDTYSIGFLLEYIRTGSVQRAGLFAATCSSFNVEQTGPYNFPNRSKVELRMSKYF